MAKIAGEISSSVISTISREAAVGLGQIALTPLFIIRFGQNDYSKWLTMLAYSSFIVLADFGLSTVIVSKLIFVLENFKAFDNLLWIWFKRKTLIIAFFMTTIVALFCAMKFPFNLTGKNFFDSNAILFMALAVSSFVTLHQHFWLYKLQIVGLASHGQKRLTAMRSLEIVSIASLLNFDFSLIAFAWIFVFLKILFFLLLKISNRNLLAKYPNFISNQSTNGLMIPAISNGFITSANVISLHGTLILASTWLGPKALIAIVVARMLTSPIRILGTAFTSASLPFLIRANHSNSFEKKSLRILKLLPKVSILVLLSATCILLAISNTTWNILSHHIIPYNRTLVIMFALSTLSDAILAIRFQPKISSNSAFVGSVIYLLSTTISTISQRFAGIYIGIVAVPICIIIADLITLSYIFLSEWQHAN